MFIHGGRGWNNGGSTCLQHELKWRLCRVESDAKILKAEFCSFRYTFDQNTLLKTSQTIRKCAQECSSEQMRFNKVLKVAKIVLPMSSETEIKTPYLSIHETGKQTKSTINKYRP